MMKSQSWFLQNEDTLNDLVTLTELTDQEIALLTALEPLAHTAAPGFTEVFFMRLATHELTQEFVPKQTTKLKNTLEQWFIRLFQGNYGREYLQSRLRIGQMHVRIGLPVRYPLAMMDAIMQCGEIVTRQSTKPEAAGAAFDKLLSIDIAMFTHAYEDAHLYHLARLIGNERLARRLLSGKQ